MSEGQKFIAAVALVILGGLAAIAGVSFVFYALGVPARNATIAGALVVSIMVRVVDLAMMVKGGNK